jgi:peptide deformylase
MSVLKIARMGHPVLLRSCEPVDDPGAPEIRRLVADMIETMEDAPGVGLAAPQVHIPLRLFVFRVPGERAGADTDDVSVGNSVLINPVLELVGDERALGWEGCLSIPGMRAAVPRVAMMRKPMSSRRRARSHSGIRAGACPCGFVARTSAFSISWSGTVSCASRVANRTEMRSSTTRSSAWPCLSACEGRRPRPRCENSSTRRTRTAAGRSR